MHGACDCAFLCVCGNVNECKYIRERNCVCKCAGVCVCVCACGCAELTLVLNTFASKFEPYEQPINQPGGAVAGKFAVVKAMFYLDVGKNTHT